MLRLNQLIRGKHLTKLSTICPNSAKTSQYQYSSEPPDQRSAVQPTKVTPQRVQVDVIDAFFRKTATELKLFGPQDIRAPLNGNIGLASDNTELEIQALLKLIRETRQPDLSQKSNHLKPIQSLLSDGPQTRCHKFFQILKYQRLFPKEMVCVTKSSDSIECTANDLTFNNIKKFVSLFPKSKKPELENGLTVVTMTKKTNNDMTSYSEEVELERDHFFEQFITDAKDICKQLHSSGYWADFIDPYSGQPFMSEHTNDTFFETDERFFHLGFKVEDLGCCKAIYHSKWSTHVIVGTIFTTAPAESPVVNQMMTTYIK